MIAVNNILKHICKLNGLGFIDNSNICAENLFEDDLHLNEDAKMILASKNDSLLKSNFYSNNDKPSMISNSSEVK